MTDEEIAQQALAPLRTKLFPIPRGYEWHEIVTAAVAACAQARAEGRAEVQREWDDAEITRGEHDE